MFWKNYRKGWGSVFLYLLLFMNALAFARVNDLAQLTQLHVSNTHSSSRIILTLTQKTTYKILSLSKPDRLVIDLNKTQKNFVVNNPASKLIHNFRLGHPRPETLRLVFGLTQPVKIKVFTYVETHSHKQKIMIDVYGISTEIKTPKRKYIIVIDPGHGGKDSGAVGAHHVYEKNIVLAISKQLAKLINNQPNFKVFLTRSGDYYMPLRKRLKVARQNKADMFVAIHADSYYNTAASGASVYALSQRGATSEAARWLAKRENYSELDGIDLNELNNQSYFLRYVMIDLAQTATISDSLRLGASLISALQEVARLRYRRVEQAPFVVLKSPDIPSVLVEVGFISNAEEELRLRNPTYQKKLAQALLKGLLKYQGCGPYLKPSII
jgi:N-acetylmuramoyl-L-alanine amidase